MERYFLLKNEIEEYVAPEPYPRFARFLIDKDRIKEVKLSMVAFRYAPGQIGPAHRHTQEVEVYYVLRGKGEIRLNKDKFELQKDAVVYILPGVEHETKNTGKEDLEFLAIFTPSLNFKEMKKKWKKKAATD